MSPSDFNPWGMGSSGKSRSVFFSVHLHHSRNGPGNVPCLKSVCLAGFGKNRNLHSLSEAPVNSSLFNQRWIWSWNFRFEGIWTTLQLRDDCRASLQAWAPCKVLWGHQTGVVCPNHLLIRCSYQMLSQDLLIIATQKMLCVSSACRPPSQYFFWQTLMF